MRYLFAFTLVFTSLFATAQRNCSELADVNAADIQVTYAAGTGISIHGTFGTLRPAEFRVQYRNLTDNGRWQTETNGTRGSDARWFINNLQQSKEYKVRIFSPYRNGWCEIDMHHIWTHINTTDFNLNGNGAGPVSICENTPIIMNAGRSRHETHYGIAIREIDAAGRGVGPEMMYERSGQAPNGIDLRAIARSKGFPLIGGKRYYVKLFTRPNWQEKIIILEMEAAEINIRPLAEPVANNSKAFSSCVFRGAPQLMVDASGSTCDTRYMVNIVEVVNGQELEATRFNEWITPFTPLPDRLDLGTIYQNAGYGFQVGKQYKVILAVGFPWSADHFYITFRSARDCAARPTNASGKLKAGF